MTHSAFTPWHTPHLASFPMLWPPAPAPAPWAPPATPAQAPQPAPWAHLPQTPVVAGGKPPPPPLEARVGSPASRQLTIEVPGLSPETMTTSAVRDAVRAHLGSTKFVVLLSLRHGCKYVTCFEAVWRAFAGDQTRALMLVMTAAGYVTATLRSHPADGTLFFPPPPPPSRDSPPRRKLECSHLRRSPRWGSSRQPQWPCPRHQRHSHRHPPSRPTAPPRPRPGPQPSSPTRTRPCSRRRRHCGLPKGRRPTLQGRQEAEQGGTDSPSTSPKASAAQARSGLWWWPCCPTPPQVRALASVISDLFRDAPPRTRRSRTTQVGSGGAGPRLPPLCRMVPAPSSGHVCRLLRLWLPGGAAPPRGGGPTARVVRGVRRLRPDPPAGRWSPRPPCPARHPPPRGAGAGPLLAQARC